MIQRCHSPNSSGYARYGARGIQVCEQWRRSFVAFFNHIGPRPTPDHSIDRIDNDRGYEPGNVRWALPREQMQNTTQNRFITLQGDKIIVAEAARRLGWDERTLRSRLRLGWELHDVVSVPRGARNRWHKHPWAAKVIALAQDGMPVKDIAAIVGTNYHNVYKMLWSRKIKIPKAPRPLRKPPLDMDVVREMFEAGYILDDIAIRQDTSRARIARAVRAARLRRKRPYGTNRIATAD